MLVKKILSPGDSLEDAYIVRTEVFVEEQGFSRGLEVDALDPVAFHVVFYSGGEPAATGRAYPDPDKPGSFHIGRVAVRKHLRGTGLGRLLMDALEELARDKSADTARLGAQCQVRAFYEKRGYTAYGDIFYDETCPHIHMEKSLV